MLESILQEAGYRVKMLDTNAHTILEEGQKYVHNDACYPAILVIGQLIDAIHRGGYDSHKVALFITQTGGGCRASNYIHLLRKALQRAGLEYVPVISLNLSGMEKNPGFKLTLDILRKAVFAVIYGDLMMNISWQVRPYEITAGDTDRCLAACREYLLSEMRSGRGMQIQKHGQKF